MHIRIIYKPFSSRQGSMILGQTCCLVVSGY